MKKIVINPDCQQIDHTAEKIRLISLNKGKILLINYDGFLMLPGGKKEKEETNVETLFREVKEETGNELKIEEIEQYLEIENRQQNYNSRDFNFPINKCTRTIYYITEKEVDLTQKRILSEKEKSGKYTIEYIPIFEVLKRLREKESEKKKSIYKQELAIVIETLLKNTKWIDLHTHSCYSDGEYTPDELIEKAKQENIKTIAITDHDTILGLENIKQAHQGIEVIPGIEFSVKREKGRMHILGLDINPKDKEIKEVTTRFKEINIENIKKIVEYLKKEKNIELNPNDLEAIYHQIGNVGRPDIAKLLIKEKYVKTVNDAFEQYLVEAYNNTRKVAKGYTFEDIIKLILNANGIPILAHPNSLELDKIEFEKLLQEMIKSGLMGLECFHYSMSYGEMDFYMEMIKKYNLLYSAGSDYHGPLVKPYTEVGKGSNNVFQTDASVLKYIHNRKNNHIN